MNLKQLKLFPKNTYSIELVNDNKSVISNLKNSTLSKEQYVANWNNQLFIGTIKENEFELKLSKKLYGDFCIVHGKLENNNGTLEIQTGNVLKTISILILLFTLSGIITAMIYHKFEQAFKLMMAIVMLRFIILELVFKNVSKIVLQKLTEAIKIKSLQKKITLINCFF